MRYSSPVSECQLDLGMSHSFLQWETHSLVSKFLFEVRQNWKEYYTGTQEAVSSASPPKKQKYLKITSEPKDIQGLEGVKI